MIIIKKKRNEKQLRNCIGNAVAIDIIIVDITIAKTFTHVEILHKSKKPLTQKTEPRDFRNKTVERNPITIFLSHVFRY